MIELEGYAEKGMFVVGGSLINLLREKFSVPIFKAYVSARARKLKPQPLKEQKNS